MRSTQARTTAVVTGALLALAGLPAASAATESPVSAGTQPTVRAAPAVIARAQPHGTGGVTVTIPVVAFPAHVGVYGGRLRTPVLLADPTVGATAVVPRGTGAGCTVELVQGTPGWLDCAVPSSGAVVVVVTMSDGRQVTRVARRGESELPTRPGRTVR